MAVPDVEQSLYYYDQAKAHRSQWDSLWRETARLVHPNADDFTPGPRQEGDRNKTRDIYDSRQVIANQRCAAVLMAALTPMSQTYQRLRATDEELNEDPETVEWLEYHTRVLMQVRASPRAGFYPQAHEGYLSLGAFGNSCMYVEEVPGVGVRYKHCSIADVWVATNHLRQIDTIYYRYFLTPKAAVQRWGERAPAKARSATNAWQPIEFVHIVAPNLQIQPDRLDQEGRAWTSVDICVEDKTLVESGFFDELPYIYSRFSLNPGETYGRGPAMLALDTIKTLQEMKRTLLRSAHKAADPPLLLRADAQFGLGARRPRLNPGGLNPGGLDGAGREMIKALMSGSRPEITLELMEGEGHMIDDAFLGQAWRPVFDNPEMTATQVLAIEQKLAMTAAPAISRQQTEFLGPLTDRELRILKRSNRMRPLPERFRQGGGDYDVQYESAIARNQRMDELFAIRDLLEMMAPLTLRNPSLMEMLDDEKIVRRIAQIRGVPEDLIRDPDDYAKRLQGAARADAEAMAVEAAPAAASVISALGKLPPGAGGAVMRPAA